MSRTYVPFVLYLVLAVIAVSVLRAEFLLAVLFLLGGLAAKTWVGQQKDRGTPLGLRSGTIGPEPSPKTGEPQE
jgi:hypothetical protein